jgi:hypothetical protein
MNDIFTFTGKANYNLVDVNVKRRLLISSGRILNIIALRFNFFKDKSN